LPPVNYFGNNLSIGASLERLVKFKVLGQEYPLYTDAPEDEVEEILHLVKSQIEKSAQGSTHMLPASKLAVLSSLNMAGKYVKLKKDFEQYRQAVDSVSGNLLFKLEELL
jgi:cell division protein ZapA (FtsZ GTPase activity inhibitor)